MNSDPLELSQQLLSAARKGETRDARKQLAEMAPAELYGTEEGKRKAFWLNTYNAYVQVMLDEMEWLYRIKPAFYYFRKARIAGKKLSLNRIEHGMLRHSKLSFGFGYLDKPLVPGYEKKARVELDPRIHFALNCGASSCPPIQFYSENVDAELDTATESYLSREVKEEEGILLLPRMFLWFRGDFGGRPGIMEFLEEHDAIEAGTEPKLEYRSYDWSLEPGDFRKP